MSEAQNDQKDIVNYLKGWPNSFVSGKEIARKVGGKKRYEEDRGWAIPVLVQMVRMGTLETDHLGYYRLNIDLKKKEHRQHVSPQILKILKTSGKSFECFELEEGAGEPPIPTYQKPADRPARPGEKKS